MPFPLESRGGIPVSLFMPDGRGHGYGDYGKEPLPPFWNAKEYDFLKRPAITSELFEPEFQREINKWNRSARRIVEYKGGVYPDGTIWRPGRRLLIKDQVKKEWQQVMDDFEVDWCKKNTEIMFAEKKGPLVVVEAGFGMGITSQFVLQEMLSRGGVYVISELNNQVFRDGVKWVNKVQNHIDELGIPLKIIIVHGEADTVISRFPDKSIDLLFHDTHQLIPEHIGVNDMLKLEIIKRKQKPDGHVSICPFHRDNQTGGLDARQIAVITPHYIDIHISTAIIAVPPDDSTYAKGPRIILPVVVLSTPRINHAMPTAA